MINHARKRQRDLFITLIDLRNAFGEVHHSLLNKVLEYHHVPNEVKSLIQNMHKDFHISIGTKRFITGRIKVERGVHQGDCLSPLLFNMCFNTLIQTIRQKKIHGSQSPIRLLRVSRCLAKSFIFLTWFNLST